MGTFSVSLGVSETSMGVSETWPAEIENVPIIR